MMVRVRVESKCDIPSKYNVKDEDGLNDIKSHTFNKSYWMLAINELGIYEALFASRKLEARQFRRWTGEVMQKLRKGVGLQGYEVMRMTEPDIQQQIDWFLDAIYYDEETGKLMYSKVIAGGDVDQIPLDEYLEGE